MKTSIQFKPIPALVLFCIGFLLAAILSTLAVWADYEAASYGFADRASTLLNGLSCPILMTRGEIQTVSIKLTNRTNQILSPSIKTDISTSNDPIASIEMIRLSPGESRLLQWPIGPENIEYDRFVFVNVLVYSTYPVPNKENTCGVFVLPVPGNGKLILILTASFSLLCMGSGYYFLRKSNLPIKYKRSVLFLALVIGLTMLANFASLWIQAIFLLAITVLAIFTILSSLLV